MERKYQIIYIWSFIIVSSIILLLLYTPLGGDLNQSSNNEYSIENNSVDFGGKISNSPRRSYSEQSVSGSGVNVIPTYRKNNKTFSTNNTNTGTADNFSNNTYSVNTRSTMSTAQTGGNSGGGGGVAPGVFGTGKADATSSAGSGSSYGGGANSPFSTTTPSSNSVMQKSTSGTNAGNDLTDPGGEDPIGDPLPIGDGLYLLIAMVLVYSSKFIRK